MNNDLINPEEESPEEETTSSNEQDISTGAEEEAVEETEEEEESFAALLEKSVEDNKRIEEGKLVTGIVVSINREEVLIDVGYKSEGVIPIGEFKKVDGKLDLNIGDEVEVVVESKENASGQVKLSQEKANKIRMWNEISKAFEKGGLVNGTITNKIKGGFSVDIGVKAFLPASQVDNRPVRDFDQYVSNEYQFKILEFNKAKGNIVLSRKVLLDVESKKLKEQLLNDLKEGAKLKGIVKNITDYGVFVDLGSIDGLLHITDISWGRVSHPSDAFKVGDEIDVVVLKYDRESQRISLGHKQLANDPWESALSKYPIGAKVKGKVVTIVDYGAFIELEAGIEGLIHISEMSWTKKSKHPSNILTVGNEIEASVLSLDSKNRRLSLGLKQVQDNPWNKIAEKYPPGTIVERPIKNITTFGLFIEFEDNVDGLIHISDISWGKKVTNLKDLYKKGDMVKAKVIEINAKNDKCSLSIKDLTDNPWKNVEKTFKKGSIVTGTVTKITEFGAFVELAPNIEGLIHISEIKSAKDAGAPDHIKVGETIKALVLQCSSREKRISLSVKDLERRLERDEIKKYLASQEQFSSKLMDFVVTNKNEEAPAAKEAPAEEPAAVEPEAAAEEPATPTEAAAEPEAAVVDEPEAPVAEPEAETSNEAADSGDDEDKETTE